MRFTNKLTAFGLAVTTLVFSLAAAVSAHVTVKPGEVLTGQFQTFTVGVPVEKDSATTAVRLDIPAGLGHVTPSLKAGWTIAVDKQGEGEETVVKSITWSGSEIASGYRDDFTFSAQVPDKPADLRWKAYQTYADGTVVNWDLTEDQQPKKEDGSPDFSKSGPFSVTKVTSESPQDAAVNEISEKSISADTTANRALFLSIGAALIGLVAIYLATRKQR